MTQADASKGEKKKAVSHRHRHMATTWKKASSGAGGEASKQASSAEQSRASWVSPPLSSPSPLGIWCSIFRPPGDASEWQVRTGCTACGAGSEDQAKRGPSRISRCSTARNGGRRPRRCGWAGLGQDMGSRAPQWADGLLCALFPVRSSPTPRPPRQKRWSSCRLAAHRRAARPNPHAFSRLGVDPPHASPCHSPGPGCPRRFRHGREDKVQRRAAKGAASRRPHRTSGGLVSRPMWSGRAIEAETWIHGRRYSRTTCLSYFPSAHSPFPLGCHAKEPSKGPQVGAPVASSTVRSVGCWGRWPSMALWPKEHRLYITRVVAPEEPLSSDQVPGLPISKLNSL